MGTRAEYLQKWANKNASDDAGTTVANLMLALHVLTGIPWPHRTPTIPCPHRAPLARPHVHDSDLCLAPEQLVLCLHVLCVCVCVCVCMGWWWWWW